MLHNFYFTIKKCFLFLSIHPNFHLSTSFYTSGLGQYSLNQTSFSMCCSSFYIYSFIPTSFLPMIPRILFPHLSFCSFPSIDRSTLLENMLCTAMYAVGSQPNISFELDLLIIFFIFSTD